MTDTNSFPSSFFFANAKPSEPLSYQALQSRRKIAEALASRRSAFPKTLGEGLTYAGEKFADAFDVRNLDEQDRLLAARQVQSAAEANKAYEAVPPAVSPAGSEGGATPPAMSVVPAAEAPPASPEARNAIATAMVPTPPPRPVRDRSAQLEEMQNNPALAPRLAAMTLGEVDPRRPIAEQQTQYATALDRAGARSIPVAQALETWTGPGSRGYYPPDTLRRGYAAIQDPERFAAFQRDVATPVLRGADPGAEALGFTPTGNASGGVAQRGIASGLYNAAGAFPGSAETYVQQERPAQLDRLARTRAALGNTDAGGPGNPPLMRPEIAVAPPAVRTTQAGSIPGPLTPPVPEPPPPSVGRVPSVSAETFTQTKQPPPTPVGRDELRAIAMMNSTQDPIIQQQWGGVRDYYKAQRERTDKLNEEAFKSELERQRAISTKQLEHTLGKDERELKLQEGERKLADARRRQEQFGDADPAVIADAIKKSSEVVKNVPASMMGIANARRNLNEGKMFTGSGAEVELTGAKLKALAGFPADPRIQPTESFRAMVAPIVAQARQALAGGANISDNDMKIAEKAAGGNITLERDSINEILSSLERINTAIAVDHQKKVLAYTGTDPNSQRAMNAYFLPMERIVPDAAVNRLIEHRANPSAIKQFDDTFSTPGLAQKILQSRGL